MTVNWTPSDDKVDSYDVIVVSDDGETITRTVKGDKNSVDITGLKERTKYTVSVIAVKDGVNSTASAELSFTTLTDGKKRRHFFLLTSVFVSYITNVNNVDDN